MADPNSLIPDENNARHYKQLGLEPGAPMRDVEAAYWKFARTLKGQAAMAPYNTAYEALVNRNRPPTKVETKEPESAPAEAAAPRAVRPPSKLGWPT